MDTTVELLGLAKELGLNVVGVSFHVGSGASDPLAFYKAVRDARTVMDRAAEFGYELTTVDVGGGFSGDNFEQMATVLREALDDFIPAHVNVIGEPGRYYVSSAFTLACNIIARRTVHNPETSEKSYMLYLNDGVYGNFSSIMFDHQNPIAKILRVGDHSVHGSLSAHMSPNGIEYSIWGPTCDGIDHITKSIRFDHTLDVGDWLYFENMGAYTKCSATRFNGFTDAHDVIYVSSEPGAKAILGMR
jgi:ornithine decarboxylase